MKKLKMPKIDWSIIIEVIGVSIATYGVFLINTSAALIGLGGFLVWLVEKE